MGLAHCYNFQTRLNEVIVYYSFERANSKYAKHDNRFKLQESAIKIYNGEITTHARRRIKRAIECLYMISPIRKVYNRVLAKWTQFRLSHLTLTLSAPQHNMTDNEVVKYMLAPFLRSCKRHLGMNNYVWKAEKQFNYTVHYHIISDMYADMNKIQYYWNAQQTKFHYIREFKAKFGHINPPSTHIKYVKSDNQLAVYLMKYISKCDNTKSAREEFRKRATFYKSENFSLKQVEESEFLHQNKMKIKGKVWDCTRKLKAFKYFATDLSTAEDREFQDALKFCEHTQFNDEYFSIIKFKSRDYIKFMPTSLRQQYIAQFEAVQSIDVVQKIQLELGI